MTPMHLTRRYLLALVISFGADRISSVDPRVSRPPILHALSIWCELFIPETKTDQISRRFSDF